MELTKVMQHWARTGFGRETTDQLLVLLVYVRVYMQCRTRPLKHWRLHSAVPTLGRAVHPVQRGEQKYLMDRVRPNGSKAQFFPNPPNFYFCPKWLIFQITETQVSTSVYDSWLHIPYT